MAFSFKRTLALSIKESKQIVRDPSSLLIALVIPLLLLLIFGYGINLDSNKINVGVLVEKQSAYSNSFVNTINGSPYLTTVVGQNRQQLSELMSQGDIRGIVILPTDFADKALTNSATAQLITDGSEPNVATFLQAYFNGIWQIWQQQQLQDHGMAMPFHIEVEPRYWFNSAAISQHFILPGAITIVMTVIGALLTSLVIAREWERGTMEGLLSTPITKLELLLSKLLPYYILGILALIVCVVVSVIVIGVPFRGSIFFLLLISSFFLLTVLALGLLISTITKNQFNAAMIAINAAFLPAVMLSGFVFSIDSMPAVIRAATYLIPARYYVEVMQTLFLAGNILPVLVVNAGFLIGFMLLLLIVILTKTKLRLD